MYLYTAHRAKSTFHMAKATLTIKNNPQSKRTFPTFSGQGYSYTHAQLREQSDYILHWPSMAIFTLKNNSGSKAYISYRPRLYRANRLLSILAMNSHSYTQTQLTERGVHSILTTTAIFTQHILPTEGTFHTAKNHSCTLIHNTHSKAFLYTSIYVNSFTSIIAQ